MRIEDCKVVMRVMVHCEGCPHNNDPENEQKTGCRAWGDKYPTQTVKGTSFSSDYIRLSEAGSCPISHITPIEPAKEERMDWSLEALRAVKTEEEAKRWVGTTVRVTGGEALFTLIQFDATDQRYPWRARENLWLSHTVGNPYLIVAVLSPPPGASQSKEEVTPAKAAPEHIPDQACDDGHESIRHDEIPDQDDILQVLCLMCGAEVEAAHEKTHRQSLECIQARQYPPIQLDTWKCHCGAVGQYIDLEKPFTDCPYCGGEVQDS